MKTHKDTDRHPTDLKSARMNYPNSTMQPFVLQNASVGFQYPKPALSYYNFFIFLQYITYNSAKYLEELNKAITSNLNSKDN